MYPHQVQIAFDSRRKKRVTLQRAYPGALLLDVTSRGEQPWVRLSPFYPHGGLPVPFCELTSQSVEGVWQGLKVFESADVDPSKFEVRSMSGIKRSVRKNGRVLGHRRGIDGADLLGYLEARWNIYLPIYRYMLEHRAADVMCELRRLASAQQVVLLDYETNGEVEDLSRPLSHAALVVKYVLGQWPERK